MAGMLQPCPVCQQDCSCLEIIDHIRDNHPTYFETGNNPNSAPSYPPSQAPINNLAPQSISSSQPLIQTSSQNINIPNTSKDEITSINQTNNNTNTNINNNSPSNKNNKSSGKQRKRRKKKVNTQNVDTEEKKQDEETLPGDDEIFDPLVVITWDAKKIYEYIMNCDDRLTPSRFAKYNTLEQNMIRSGVSGINVRTFNRQQIKSVFGVTKCIDAEMLRILFQVLLPEINTNNENNNSSTKIPDRFLDPFTWDQGQLMRDPVICGGTGFTFERETIEEWLDQHGQDPFTEQRMTKSDLHSNIALKKEIAEWRKNNSEKGTKTKNNDDNNDNNLMIHIKKYQPIQIPKTTKLI